MEHFYTLQGEGAWAGTAAYFVRLGGCDVGCHWCDVKESWDANWPVHSATELAAIAKASGTERVVITGGEPTLHNLHALVDALHASGLQVAIETSGTQSMQGSTVDWVCFSPKKFKAPLNEYYILAHELKVIVANQHDLTWAETHADRINSGCLLYLQPEWDTPASSAWIIDYIKAHPRWRLSLQTHKFLNIP